MFSEEFDRKGIDDKRIHELLKCIICHKVIGFRYDYYHDYHAGSSWRDMVVEPYVVLSVDGIAFFKDRIVCKKCFRTRKDELKKILFEKAKDTLRRQREFSKDRIKRLRRELRAELRRLEKIRRILKTKVIHWRIEQEVV